MEEDLRVRGAVDADAAELGRCQVQCWREAYAHLLSPSLRASFSADEHRWQQWRRLIAEGSGRQVVVAEAGGRIVGHATTGSSRDDPPVRDLELVSLYLRATHHGSGLGQGLLDASIADQPCSLWMAEDNARARAFYARNGFHPDGTRKTAADREDLPRVRLLR